MAVIKLCLELLEKIFKKKCAPTIQKASGINAFGVTVTTKYSKVPL